MVDKKWFILLNDKVSGPYKSQEVLESINNNQWNEGRFWTKGQSSWKLLTEFKQTLENENQTKKEMQSNKLFWFIKDNDTELGPFTFDNMIQYLKTKLAHQNIFISQETNKNWKELFQFEEVIEKLGITRRANSRVPINGLMTIVEGELKGRKSELFSLSQGGVGVRGLEQLSLGEKIKGIISSTNLPFPIHFQGEVVFINTEKTEIGLQFSNLSAEALSQIIAYVKQFVESHPEVDFRKVS